MRSLLFSFLLVVISFTGLYSQNTLFDDTKVSSVFIELPADSLAVIFTDVLSDHYFKALFIFDYESGRDTVPNVGFRLRGNTSRFSQKKSFKISFNEYVPARKYQDVKKINLNGQHNDPTMVREKLFYDFWNKSGMAPRRTSFVKLFINQTYYGLYTNLEEFDKDWLQRVYGEKDGNLYKCTYPADLVFHGSDQQYYKNIVSGSSTGGRAYDLQTNETEDDYSDLVELITLLDNPADSTFALLIEQKLNIDGLLKAFALDVATGNWDDYMYINNNYFLYHNLNSGKFEFITYDTDNTLGVDWVSQDWTSRNCLDWYNHTEPRPLAEKVFAIPKFMLKYKQYLDTITNVILNLNLVFPQIDSLEILITEAAKADTYRTLDYGYSVTDFHKGFIQAVDYHTPYGIKPFLSKRRDATLHQLTTASITDFVDSKNGLLLYPNPAGDILNVKIADADNAEKAYILDILGQKLKNLNISDNKSSYSIPIDNIKPGVYTFVTIRNGFSESKRFVKK
ncbi:MAG: CotH kinase family protein [Bacteroidales bacterium]